MIKRQLIVPTAQHYYESAKGLNTDGEVYSQSEKIHCLGEALNHTESALHMACCLLEKYMEDNFTDDGRMDFKEEVKKFLGRMRYRQE
jgi:hypothetical protein